MPSPVILWFRRDLRLADNPALAAALKAEAPVIPVYVLDEAPEVRPMGAASLWWLDKSLTALAADLEARGSRLTLRRGDAERLIPELAAETGASAVLWNGLFDPGLAPRDTRLAEVLTARGVEPRRFNGAHLIQPEAVRTKTGGAFSVFTPFWRTARQLVTLGAAQPAPDILTAPGVWPASDTLAAWGLHPSKPDWSAGFADWIPGEAGARERLEGFVDGPLATYAADRDRPDREGVSRLSAHLHFGEISPKACWRAAQAAVVRGAASEAQMEKFLAELGWREFNAAIAGRGRDLARENFDAKFDLFPWRTDPIALEAWRRGRTGYPMVDAGLRQLWATGWMHNRVRMVVASFLTKHLLIDWREGEAWFWDTLVDADHASNAGNWQWTAGSGADASPYFRIFNPMAQGEKFDPEGVYVRRWVPELSRLPTKVIHTPWTADPAILSACGVTLGLTYPHPIVEHDGARKRALDAYQRMKAAASD
ncbi:deoxyribodipyrimidine photo-lyase [Phenylobacterium aquaticum]|uniref:cryptochrome/photolyase family protein n=2 Tax=Phenylobacterium aquaticum TaxID=1763816 RepID=UPI0026EE2DB5|nr:deoxyribodipyrimidine photo-lyase [Phenylobacterium aquaticum]